ncbi:MAG: nucleotidyltransferase family protein, partial [Gammaproteobacteria bacterium]|nr:nucleotidyltransferase family protein [Gammaproteobacteria bacterium]
RIIAVVRQDDVPLQQVLQSAGIKFVINRQANQGMGRSLACGIRASEMSDGWCILPADMPYVEKSTTLRVVEALRKGAEIAAPVYQGRRGHPVGFCTTYRDQLLALDNDVGAREILTRQAAKVESIEVEDSGILIDIDIP